MENIFQSPTLFLVLIGEPQEFSPSLQNGLLLYNQCIVVPLSLQKDMLEKIHKGHQGITLC